MNVQPLIQQLEGIVADYDAMVPRSQHNDLSDLPKQERQALVTRSVAAISRISGENSTYVNEAKRLLKDLPHLHTHTSSIIGVVKALLADVKAGHLQSLVELVHGETFADFLEMAQHLVDAGYKDAAGVIAGSALESHLRMLCAKAGVPIESTKPDGSTTPKKAESMNADLAGANVYSKLDQKNVTAWLDLRNKAAHGKYGEYKVDQVTLLIAGVRDFLTRIPA
ncbi:MAG: hypothetical protein KF892_24005 [Rhizobacter sp.]|nr:hypothetical protein [Rhizobacter sp.]